MCRIFRRRQSFRDQQTAHQANTAKAKLISITTADLYIKSNYQDFQRYAEVDIAMAADSEATLPSLIEAVKRLTTDDRKRVFQDRGTKLVDARKRALDRRDTAATNGWNASPISLPRLSAEVWAQVKNEDWAGGMGTSGSSGTNSAIHGFMTNIISVITAEAHPAIGYASPAAVGAALAHRKHGRLYVHAADGRGSDVCQRGPLDGGASRHPAAVGHA